LKLATLNNQTRDGQLVVVSRDLTRAVPVPHVAFTLQAALDEWDEKSKQLRAVNDALNDGHLEGSFPFSSEDMKSPLPRAYQWVDGSAYVNHVELVRRARGADMPPSFWSDPLVYQGGSDDFLGPTQDARFVSEEHGIDMEAEVAVIVDDVPLGIDAHAARHRIKLVTIVNDWSLRNLIPAELAKGFGFYQSKPATAFAPVAVTPDELGDAWDDLRFPDADCACRKDAQPLRWIYCRVGDRVQSGSFVRFQLHCRTPFVGAD